MAAALRTAVVISWPNFTLLITRSVARGVVWDTTPTWNGVATYIMCATQSGRGFPSCAESERHSTKSIESAIGHKTATAKHPQIGKCSELDINNREKK